MKNSSYWKKRFELLEQLEHDEASSILHTLEAHYMKAQREIEGQILSWYQRFAVNNQISMAEARKWLTTKELAEFKWDVKEYIKYGEENEVNQIWMKQLENASAKYHISRLEALKIQTQQSLEVLFGNQIDHVDDLMKKIYSEGYYHTAYELQHGFNIGWDIASIDQNKLEKIISKPWAADGRNFSERIWGNRSKLVNEVHTELTQMAILGKAPDQAIKNIAAKMNTSKTNAGRLVMTESAYFSSVAQKDAFTDLDVERFEIVATLDSRTSEICQGLDGHVFDMKDYEAGVTAPPFHVWCRTTTVPYFDDEFNLGERAARDEETGKTYYVPSNMTYPQWKQSFVDKGDKTGLDEVDPGDIMKDKKDEVQEIKKSIMDKHDKIIQSEAQKTELDQILSGHGSKELNLYDKLSNKFQDNDYHKKGGAAYYPGEKKVKMNIDNNDWERKVGNGHTGAWHTKFHEEFHQLDHMLSQTKFGLQPDGNVTPYKNLVTHFTGGNTVIGQQMITSIDDDVLSVVNKSIDWMNTNEGLKIKHLKSLDRISGDAYRATIKYLKTTYDTPKAKAQIAIFTDAMGLTTRNRLNPHGNGFWGHDASYNKDRSKDGASSETWATFGSLIYTGDQETISMVKGLMPKTWSTFSSVFEDLLEYALENDIHY
jgi:SPP1 gp7 family putative phage head morphogenesis protein